jgi:alpha-L-fucosidase 2
MLVQSQGGEIHLLPALPSAWPSGNITGLCARGGVEVSLFWTGGRLVAASFKSKLGGMHKVRYGDKVMRITLSAGRSHTVSTRDFQSA